jgi:hypothetical protein
MRAGDHVEALIGSTGRLQPSQRVNSAMRMMIGIGTPSSQSRIERMVVS